MNKLKWMGIFLVAGGLCILGYQGIESIMAEGERFYNYDLIDMFGEEVFAWSERIPVVMLADGVEYLITMPAYLLFIGLGVVFLVISGIFAKR